MLNVDPNLSGAKSWRIRLDRRSHGKWRTVGRYRTKGTGEARTFKVKAGRYRVHVYARSGYRSVTSGAYAYSPSLDRAGPGPNVRTELVGVTRRPTQGHPATGGRSGTLSGLELDTEGRARNVLGTGPRLAGVRAYLLPIMERRIAACKDKGFDAVEPDNVDGYANSSGFPISSDDQVAYNQAIAGLAHRYGLGVALKNDPGQVATLQPSFDFAIVEECARYGECDSYAPSVKRARRSWRWSTRGSRPRSARRPAPSGSPGCSRT